MRRLLSLLVVPAVLTASIGLTAPPAGAAGAPGTPSGWKTLAYRGIRFDVPASWPVFDLASSPRTCVRFDRHAVYLGREGADPACPARAIGSAGAVQVTPVADAAAAAPPHAVRTLIGGQQALVSAGDPADTPTVATFPGLRLSVTVAAGADPTLAGRILAGIRPSGGTPEPGPGATARPAPGPTGPGSPSPSPAAATPAPPTSPPTSPAAAAASPQYRRTAVLGKGFDTCAAPAQSSMQAWLASPYRSVGVYVGGVNRACTQPNLTASWVAAVEGMGWNIFPIYVGRQAPCVTLSGVSKIEPSNASGEGKWAAGDATTQAQAIGLPAGTPIYFDMEAYDPSNTSCATAVERFLSAWTNQLHADGEKSGVYSNSLGGMTTLTDNYDNPKYARPDAIWIANWDGVQSVFGDPVVPDSYWPTHQRLHQYQGGHDETYGGVSINIDNDLLDGPAIGRASKIVLDGGSAQSIYAIASDRAWGSRTVLSNSVQHEYPAWSPDGTKIAYDSHKGGNWNVWVMNSDGTHTRQLTNNSHFDGEPTWSPDGTQIAFVSSRSGRDQVWQYTLATGKVKQLTSTGTNDHPAWSPDGTQIAFASHRSGTWQIWILTLSGGVRRLTNDAGNDENPSWSPDGTQIAYDSTPVGGNADIWAISVATGATVRETSSPAQETDPAWSPSGLQIAYDSDVSGTINVWELNLTGGTTQLTTATGAPRQHPSWHSDP